MSRPSRAVLWDMDGTLIDSAEYHFLAWRDALAPEGIDLDWQGFVVGFGRRNPEVLRGHFGPGISEADIERISDVKERTYRSLVRSRGIEALPGVRHWLDRLRGDGWAQAVASSAPRQNLDTILEVLQLGSIFGAVVSAEDVTRGKPDPEVFLVAARRLETAADHCVVVEDAPAGVEAARRAGMAAIAVRSPHHAELKGDFVVDSLEDLLADAFDRLVPRG